MSRSNMIVTLVPALVLVSAFLLTGCGSEESEQDGSASVSGSPTSASDAESGDTNSDDPLDDSSASADDSTSSPTDTDSDTDTDSESSFIEGDMSGDGCGTMCDIWTPGDCPEGEKCTAVACETGSFTWDSNVCRPLQGDNQPGDECTGAYGVDGVDDCGAGMMCYNANSASELGNCVEFCIGSVDAPGCASNDTICAVWNNGVLPLCLPTCDPLSIDCPNPESLCLPGPGGDGFQCVVDASGGEGTYGTPCPFSNNCNQGLLCVAAEGVPEPSCEGSSWCCSPACDVTEANACPGAGQECVHWYDPEGGSVPPGYEAVGVCALPLP